MDSSLVVRGFVIGFAVAAPIGPIGLLVIRRSLTGGAWPGLATGVGAAAADTAFALVASLGIAEGSAGLGAYAGALRVVGALLIVLLGVRAVVERAPAAAGVAAPVRDASSLARAFATTFFYTLMNPMTILSFAAIAAGAGVARSDVRGAVALSTGVLAGSGAWWLLLAGTVAALRRRIPERVLPWIGRAAGVFLVGFGAWTLVAG